MSEALTDEERKKLKQIEKKKSVYPPPGLTAGEQKKINKMSKNKSNDPLIGKSGATIKVVHEGTTFNVPVNTSGKKSCVTLKTLQRYFPSASGLMFEVNEEKHLLDMDDDLIYLQPSVNSYELFILPGI